MAKRISVPLVAARNASLPSFLRQPLRPIKMAPLVQVKPTVAPIAPPISTPLQMPDKSVALQNQLPEQFRYSKEQIDEMLARGQSETMERSGESDSGLPLADDLELKSRQADATALYMRSNGEVPPPAPVQKPNLMPLAVVAALYYLLGS